LQDLKNVKPANKTHGGNRRHKSGGFHRYIYISNTQNTFKDTDYAKLGR
jgi:hypothetical protein